MLSLGLSYEELPPHLKPCLICFSMLPEDYSIEVYDIVRWWIGEGFVLGSEVRTAFEIGRQCVAELVNRCVLIGVKHPSSGQLWSVKIHDILRDMIIKIARDENFTHLDERGRPELTVQSRLMGMFSNGIIKSIERTELKKSTIESKLRTLWALDIGKEDVLSKNMELCKLKQLRVLYVSFKKYSPEDEDVMKDWLDGIASLLHLVCLKIENCGLQNLPDSVGDLHNLQILCLSRWSSLKMLPPTITKLDKLTSFEIHLCGALECTPDGIERLSRLEILTGFCPTISSHKNTSRILHLKNVGFCPTISSHKNTSRILHLKNVGFCPTISSHKNTSRILHLKNLGQLRKLSISLKNPNNLVEGELKVLSELQNLRLLTIDFYDAHIRQLLEFPSGSARADADALASKVNNQLSPLRNVEELHLTFYPGESTPIWLNATTFPNLQFLRLFDGDIKHMDPGFWGKEHGVWKIERLLLLRLVKFQEKQERFHEALPSLKTLEFVR